MNDEKENGFDPFDEEDFFEDGEENDRDDDGADVDAGGDDGEQEQAEEGAEEVEAESEDEANATDGAESEDFASTARADLDEIKKTFPAIGIKSIGDLKNLQRFGELRSKGATPVEAFLATNAELLTANAEMIGANKATGKAHLQSVAKKSGARAASQMTSAERNVAREVFDDMSEKELEQLYARSTK